MGTPGQYSGAVRLFAGTPRQVFSGVGRSPEQMVRSLDGDPVHCCMAPLTLELSIQGLMLSVQKVALHALDRSMHWIGPKE